MKTIAAAFFPVILVIALGVAIICVILSSIPCIIYGFFARKDPIVMRDAQGNVIACELNEYQSCNMCGLGLKRSCPAGQRHS